MFQSAVNRNYTTGFPGDIVRDGPTRAKPARIASATLQTDPGASSNRVSRAFGYTSEQAAQGGVTGPTSTFSAVLPLVSVGGPNYFGVLGHPKHYALAGTVAGGTLAGSMDLPLGANAEFFDMVTGIVAEIFNETTAAKAINYGDSLAYVSSAITTAQNPLALPYGALVSVAAGSAVLPGFVAVPGSTIRTPQTLAASAAGALVIGDAVVQLTH
jgi:hypothetical protein